MANKYSLGLSITRILICFIIIKNMCFYLPLAEDYFGLNGIFPYENYIEQMNFYGLKFLTYPYHLQHFPFIFILTIILLATLYMLAIGGRFVGVMLYFTIIILKIRNGFILDGSDNVIQVVLPFLVLADNLDHFRYFKKKENMISNFISKYSVIFTYAIMIQVCFVYLFTGLAKHEGELWRNGTAVYYTMRVRDFMATNWNIPLTRNHYFVVILTYFTMFWELAFPFLVWFKKTKFWVFTGGFFLHVGIWFFMRIDNFSWVMLSTYFVFITNEEFLRFQNKKLKVFIDSWCPVCRKFGNRIKNVDFLNLIILEDVRNSKIISMELRNKGLLSMASIDDKGKSSFGFDSILRIAIRIPILWLVVPILLLLKLTKIGNYVYKELAVKRTIIPIHCNEVCKIKTF